MFGLDLVFIASVVIPNFLDKTIVKNITAITQYALLILAILNIINVSITIFKNLKKKVKSRRKNEEDN